MTIPRGFPVGNIRLSQHLGRVVRGNPLSRQIPLIAPYSGPAPRWSGGSSVDGVRRTLDARERGPLSELIDAKSRLQGQQPPHLSTQSIPPEVMTEPKVQTGGGTVRDANVPKAASEKEASLKRRLMAGLLGAGLVAGGAAGGAAVRAGAARALPKPIRTIPEAGWHLKPIDRPEFWKHLERARPAAGVPARLAPKSREEYGQWLDASRRQAAVDTRAEMKSIVEHQRRLAEEARKLEM